MYFKIFFYKFLPLPYRTNTVPLTEKILLAVVLPEANEPVIAIFHLN